MLKNHLVYQFVSIVQNHMTNLETPWFTERTATNLGRSHCLPHVCTIMIYGKFGGGYAGKVMIYLTPGRRLCFFLIKSLWSYLRRCYWKRCFANLFFPTASMDSQLVGQPPLHSHSIASSPALQVGKPECYGACQLCSPYRSEPLPERTSDRMPAYLSIYLSVCLAS